MSINIVQFTHPGGEHSFTKSRNDGKRRFKDWNNRKHQRKYLRVSGTYINKEGIKTEETDKKIYFWGEWEPESEVFIIAPPLKDADPHFIHEPFIQLNESKQLKVPESVPQINKDNSPKKNKDGSLKQDLIAANTDPFVFGEDGFYYSCCKQYWKGKPTKLQDLEPGSIILFGSTINQNTPKAYFALDTVFVVGPNKIKENLYKQEYNINFDLSKLKEFAPKYYCDIMNYKDWGKNSNCFDNGSASGSCGSTKNGIKYICYHGASYDNPITCENDSTKKMYSFAPCKIGSNGENGFERVKLSNEDFQFITNNLNSRPKVREKSFDEIYDIWKNLRDYIEGKGYYEAVRLNYTEINI